MADCWNWDELKISATIPIVFFRNGLRDFIRNAPITPTRQHGALLLQQPLPYIPDVKPRAKFLIGGALVNGSIVRDPGGRQVAFKMTDGAETYNVVYRGITPDTFTDGVDVVVEGRLGHDGTFRATTRLAKCASRYENAPEKYKDTPGYKRAEQRA